MTEVVGERDGFSEVFIQLERAGDAAGNGGNFHRVREPCAEMITRAVQKNLRFVFKPAEGARVDDAVAIALVFRAPGGRRLAIFAASTIAAHLRVRRKDFTLDLLQLLSCSRHEDLSEQNTGRRQKGNSRNRQSTKTCKLSVAVCGLTLLCGKPRVALNRL
jgi:hypothetical protein